MRPCWFWMMNGFLFDMHVHTTSSDGHVSPEEVVRAAQSAGLSGVAITDHHTIEGALHAQRFAQQHYDGKFCVIIGSEVSALEGLHIVGLFLKKGLCARTAEEVMDEIKGQGGLTVIAHPVRIPFLRWLRRKDIVVPAPGCLGRADLLEIWNSRSSARANAMAAALASTWHKTPLAGSDAHYRREIGRGTVIIWSDSLNEDAVKCALAHQRVSLGLPGQSSRLFHFLDAARSRVRGMLPTSCAFV